MSAPALAADIAQPLHESTFQLPLYVPELPLSPNERKRGPQDTEGDPLQPTKKWKNEDGQPTAEFKCDTCLKTYSTKESWRRHQKQHYSEQEQELHWFYCPYAYDGCEYRNMQKSLLWGHMRAKHPDQPITCQEMVEAGIDGRRQCGVILRSHAELCAHSIAVHYIQRRDDRIKPKCDSVSRAWIRKTATTWKGKNTMRSGPDGKLAPASEIEEIPASMVGAGSSSSSRSGPSSRGQAEMRARGYTFGPPYSSPSPALNQRSSSVGRDSSMTSTAMLSAPVGTGGTTNPMSGRPMSTVFHTRVSSVPILDALPGLNIKTLPFPLFPAPDTVPRQ
ncbi:hypothetical protein OBBRIDRAFT_886768 [Obba rivulosa]|uniref:C2H2-type domain-containing protein n=1 Tax=Obba rivulosa TaxID=1052685 RepID=A0A8E2AVK8_9APHY|nr:hypothetical protein OBBRIDRAFT_886768 [Obba rivulosa]